MVPAYAEREAAPALRRYVAATWCSGPRPAHVVSAEPVIPDGCIDVIWGGDRLFVAGPDTGPNWAVPGGHSFVGLRFRPGMGPLFLGIPADSLRDQRVELGLLWPDAERLAEAMAGSATLRHGADRLEAEMAGRLRGLAAPDPLVEAAARVWRSGAGPVGTGWLSQQAGISDRQLHRRFVAAVGYGPKLLERVLRFQRFLAASRDTSPGLAELAARTGYADQAHLTRETRALAGLTPARLRAARLRV